MKLHTPKQAPGEGQKAEKAPQEQPVAQWTPTREGYLSFLVQSQLVYQTLEEIMASGSHPSYAKLTDTGLERSAALEEDIAWMVQEYGLARPTPIAGSSGYDYAAYLKDLAARSPPAFVCHWYNQYFAHTAGGQMIGRKMSAELIEGKTLKFYQWQGVEDVKELMEPVRASINDIAEGWDREMKDTCLEETELSFKYSGALLREIAMGGGGSGKKTEEAVGSST